MQKTNFKTKPSYLRVAAPLAFATLVGAMAIACGETDDDPGLGGAGGPITGATAGNTGATPGGGVLGAGPVQPGPGGGGTTGGAGGVVGTPGTAGGGATGGGVQGGTAQPGGGGGTAGAGVDTPWCKVKKIVDAKCVACHTTPLAAGAPFPLQTWADFQGAGKGGKKIYERVGVRISADKSQADGAAGIMPPGNMLPADQVAIIDSWIAAGAPQGENPTCAGVTDPGPKQPQVEWPPAECDGVYKITAHAPGAVNTPFSVPAKQEIHPQVQWSAPWGSEKVQAIGFKTITDNTAVLHHWILYSQTGAFLTGWAPGEDGVKMMGPDIGMEMPSGANSLRLDMHYNSLTQSAAQNDASGLEICVVKQAKFRKNTAAVTMGLSTLAINIPPNSKGVKATGTYTYTGTQPVTLLTASPHAHTYARRMTFSVKKKNGQTIMMHDMPFMFGEQKSYPLNPPVVIENGDVITTVCTYDNMTNAAVRFGEDTGNEMCFNFALYYPAGALGGILGGGLGGLLGGGGGFIGGP